MDQSNGQKTVLSSSPIKVKMARSMEDTPPRLFCRDGKPCEIAFRDAVFRDLPPRDYTRLTDGRRVRGLRLSRSEGWVLG